MTFSSFFDFLTPPLSPDKLSKSMLFSLQIKGLPFGNIFSVSDGPLDNSTGVVYFYVTPMDNSVSDLKSNPYASLTFSEAEGEFCR